MTMQSPRPWVCLPIQRGGSPPFLPSAAGIQTSSPPLSHSQLSQCVFATHIYTGLYSTSLLDRAQRVLALGAPYKVSASPPPLLGPKLMLVFSERSE